MQPPLDAGAVLAGVAELGLAGSGASVFVSFAGSVVAGGLSGSVVAEGVA